MCEACDLEAALASAELDLLERDLDIAAGLIPAWARRPLTHRERQARVNFARLAIDVDDTAAKVVGILKGHRGRIADEVARQLRGAATPAELTAIVTRIADPNRPITLDVRGYDQATARTVDDIAAELEAAYRSGLQAVRAEAAAQGTPTVDLDRLLSGGTLPADVAADLRRQAEAAANAPAQVVTRAVTQAAARLPIAGQPVAASRAALEAAARDDLAAGLETDAARTPVQQAQAGGRSRGTRTLPKAARYYASELLDSSTCGPCSLVDGVEYDTLEAATADYPTGTYIGCQGGQRCRGTIVIVWDTEADPTVNDVAPVPRPEPPEPTPPPAPDPPPTPPANPRKGRKLTAAEREAAFAEFAAETGYTVDEVRAADAQLADLRTAVRAEAQRTNDAAREWFTGGASPIDGQRGGGYVQMTKPPKAVRHVDPRTGAVRWRRTGDGSEADNRRALNNWDWLEQVDPGELARLQKRGWFSDDGGTPDQIIESIRTGRSGVTGAARGEVGLDDEEALYLWRQHASLLDASGSVARGRPYGGGHIVDYGDIAPELTADGWDVDKIVAATPSEFDPDAILHVLTKQANEDADYALRELFDEYRLRTGSSHYSALEGPAPWRMTTASYRDELTDLEHRISTADALGLPQIDADIDRWNELVPIVDVDDLGAALSPEDLHARIVDLAVRADAPGARPLEVLNGDDTGLVDEVSQAEADALADAARLRAERETAAREAREAARRAEEEAQARALEEATARARAEEARRAAEEAARAEVRRQEVAARQAAAIEEAEAAARAAAQAPAAPWRQPVDALVIDDRTPDYVTEFLEELGQHTGVADDGFAPTELVWRNQQGTKGGHFSPAARATGKPRRKKGESYADHAARVRAWRTEPLRPEIHAYRGGNHDAAGLSNLLHEFGHRVDALGGDKFVSHGAGRVLLADNRGVPRPDDATPTEVAVAEFLQAANGTDAVRTFYGEKGLTADYRRYLRETHELWARAYAQYWANRLGAGPDASRAGRHALAGFRACRDAEPYFAWTDEEFEVIAPHVENVLRTRGLLD